MRIARQLAGMSSDTRVICYVRVSTDKQVESGLGLEAQRAVVETECQRRGWTIIDVVVDEGMSAKSLQRPGIQSALDRLNAGEADVLVCAKLDRLSRSVMDVCQIGSMAGHYGWNLVLLDCNVDTTTPYGKAQLNMMATFAQLERELIGIRTKEALQVKKSQGVRLGRPVVMGAAIEERIAHLRQAGLSMARIAETLNVEGVPTVKAGSIWRASTVQRVLVRSGA